MEMQETQNTQKNLEKDKFPTLKVTIKSQAWWHVFVIPALGRIKQKDYPEFEASLHYIAIPDQPGLHRNILSKRNSGALGLSDFS